MTERSVLVTGASTGLGLETSLLLAERGFKVYASMRDLSRRDALEAEAERRQVKLRVLKLNIGDPQDIDCAVRTVLEETGGIYALVNNAGIGLRGFFEDSSDEEIREVFEVNVFGTMAVTRAVLPAMRAARGGRIVVVTSVGGRIGSLGVSAYCSTKFAQEGFAESLALEMLPFGVYVSIVEPAIIKTERWSINRGIASGALNPESPYYAWFKTSEKASDRLVETSPTKPVDMAKVVHEILSADRPHMRYIVGRRAKMAIALRRYMPNQLFEKLYFGTAIKRVTQPE